jgi:hypothetical protein
LKKEKRRVEKKRRNWKKKELSIQSVGGLMGLEVSALRSAWRRPPFEPVFLMDGELRGGMVLKEKE